MEQHEHRFKQRGKPWPFDMTCDCGYTKAEERGHVVKLPDGRYRVVKGHA
jgi:hypothetical protein